MKRISVFCGSSKGAHPDSAEAAGDLGRLLAERKLGLLNVDGFFEPPLEQFDRARNEKSVRPDHRAWLQVSEDPVALVDQLLTVPARKRRRQTRGRRVAP